MKRTLFLGQKPIGERCFELLRQAEAKNICVAGVVSNDTDDVWWGTKKIFEIAQRDSIPFVSNKKRNNEAIKGLIAENHINTIISVQHSWVLPREILEMVNNFAFNLHNAKLPDYKGHNAINHAILNGEKYYTSTIHWIVEEVDKGDVAIEESFPIAPDETAKSLYEKAYHHGCTAFSKLIDAFVNEREIPKKPMIGEGVFYPRSSIDNLKEIKNVDDFDEVDRKSRAFYFPYFENAYFLIGDQKFYVTPKNPPLILDFEKGKDE